MNLIVGLTTLIASPLAQATTRVEVPEVNQPPFYARISRAPAVPNGDVVDEFYHNDEWAAIPFYRDPATVPNDFNLLEFFDFRLWTGEVVSPLTVEGFEIWEVFPPTPESFPAPLATKTNGLGSMPIWFVPWPELQQAVMDGKLTVPDLAAMHPRKGVASTYTENLYPPTPGNEISGLIALARGHLQDGTSFRFDAGVADFGPACCSSGHTAQFVNIEFGAIPEPSCVVLLILGLVALSGCRGRRGLRS
jgi:hypothetical protein